MDFKICASSVLSRETRSSEGGVREHVVASARMGEEGAQTPPEVQTQSTAQHPQLPNMVILTMATKPKKTAHPIIPSHDYTHNQIQCAHGDIQHPITHPGPLSRNCIGAGDGWLGVGLTLAQRRHGFIRA